MWYDLVYWYFTFWIKSRTERKRGTPLESSVIVLSGVSGISGSKIPILSGENFPSQPLMRACPISSLTSISVAVAGRVVVGPAAREGYVRWVVPSACLPRNWYVVRPSGFHNASHDSKLDVDNPDCLCLIEAVHVPLSQQGRASGQGELPVLEAGVVHMVGGFLFF